MSDESTMAPPPPPVPDEATQKAVEAAKAEDAKASAETQEKKPRKPRGPNKPKEVAVSKSKKFRSRSIPMYHPYQKVTVPVTHGVPLDVDSWVEVQVAAKVIEETD